jgi:hypothetical protein
MKIDKFLHNFTVNKEIEIEEVEASTNEKGEEVKTIKKVKIVKPIYFRILKPNRRLFDEAELFYGVKLSEGIKAGLLTRSLLAKRYQNDGGAMSEPEKQRYAVLYIELYRLENELQKLQVNLEKLSKDEQIEKMSKVLNEITMTKKELQEIENYQSTLFDQTAENRARNQTIMWWVLFLGYFSEDDIDYKSFFEEGDHSARLNVYDKYEENDDLFYKEAMGKLAYFVSLWYMGRANSKEDFDNLEHIFEQSKLNKQDKDQKEEVKEESKNLEVSSE